VLSDCAVGWAIWAESDLLGTFRICNLIDVAELLVENGMHFLGLQQLALDEKNGLCDFEVRPNYRLLLHLTHLDTWVNLFKVTAMVRINDCVFIFD